jgi:hypothetical protein
MSGLEANLLGIGLNVALKGLSWLDKALKSEERIKRDVLKKVTKQRQGLSKTDKNHVSFLVIPSGCGKTSLMKNLSTVSLEGNHKLMILDLDSVMTHELSPLEERKIEEAKLAGLGDSVKVKMFLKIKELYDTTRETFKNYRLILLSSELELGSFLGIDDVVIVVPDRHLLHKIANAEDISVEKRKLIMDQWTLLISNGEKRFDVYRSFDELESMIKKSFNLVNKL